MRTRPGSLDFAAVTVLFLVSAACGGCAALGDPGPVVYHYRSGSYYDDWIGKSAPSPVSVPEPGALGLMGLGLVGLGVVARRRRK